MHIHPSVSRVAQVMGRQVKYLQEIWKYARARQGAPREAHTSLNFFSFERYGSGKHAVKYIRKPLARCF